MSERAKDFVSKVWELGADTEEKLVSGILKLVAEEIKFYRSQNDLIVLDKNDLIALSEEILDETKVQGHS